MAYELTEMTEDEKLSVIGAVTAAGRVGWTYPRSLGRLISEPGKIWVVDPETGSYLVEVPFPLAKGEYVKFLFKLNSDLFEVVLKPGHRSRVKIAPEIDRSTVEFGAFCAAFSSAMGVFGYYGKPGDEGYGLDFEGVLE